MLAITFSFQFVIKPGDFGLSIDTFDFFIIDIYLEATFGILSLMRFLECA